MCGFCLFVCFCISSSNKNEGWHSAFGSPTRNCIQPERRLLLEPRDHPQALHLLSENEAERLDRHAPFHTPTPSRPSLSHCPAVPLSRVGAAVAATSSACEGRRARPCDPAFLTRRESTSCCAPANFDALFSPSLSAPT